MNILDLVRSNRDGSMSLTKLAATMAHILMAVGFAKITWQTGFNAELWLIYGGYALGHAMFDKASAQVQAYKDKQLTTETPP
jgi:hypothetical protein